MLIAPFHNLPVFGSKGTGEPFSAFTVINTFFMSTPWQYCGRLHGRDLPTLSVITGMRGAKPARRGEAPLEWYDVSPSRAKARLICIPLASTV